MSSGSPVRTFFEALLLGITLLILLVQLGTDLPAMRYLSSVVSITLVCAMACALRLTVPAGSWRRQLIYEFVAGLIAVLLIAWLLFRFIHLLAPEAQLEQMLSGDVASTYATMVRVGPVIVLFIFIMLRILKHAWRSWEQMRRKHLIWQIAHGQLLMVVLVVALAGVGTIVTASLGEPGPLLVSLFNVLAGVMTYASGLSVVLLLFILAPASILAYFVSRRITRRLQRLTKATGALRAGDYRVRVQVTGEDEVAQLQSDFNAMADDLERALRELQAERDAVAALLESRRELFASVSHDLRTPVATLRGTIESALERETAALSPVLRQDMEIMDGEVIHLQRLIDDLFTVARTELDRLGFQMQPTEILPLLQRVVKSASPIAWRKGKVQMVADLPPQLPLVKVDKIRLEQIVNNLLQNALRHTPPGGIVVVSARTEPRAVVIQVKDTGEGIVAEDLSHIWERYYRVDETRAERRGGTGLGLALVKELTEAMGGTVSVESQVGKGSCFTIWFPCAD
ncbi:MAG: ATP-binding protein [Chloroflexota bacterium]|nr:ATP-binding protein [Chloroflexota bacterium]